MRPPPLFLYHHLRPRLLLLLPLLRRTTTTRPAPPSLVRRAFAPVSVFFAFYGASQRAHPWITQIATSTTINALGDVNAQLLFPSPEVTSSSSSSTYDPLRTARMMLTGAALAIPVNSWYTRIAYCFSSLPRAVAVALQVGLSQAVFTPLFLVGFFGVQGVLEGHSWDAVRGKILDTGPRAWRDGLVLWPAVSTFNFVAVPLEYRALVGGVASLGWNTWLSYLNSRMGKAVEQEEVAAGAPMVGLKVCATA